jgi:phosphoserine phosphatase RsbU/P
MIRILIVDDSPSDRELLTFSLQEHFKTEAKFREASDLRTAHEYLKRGNIDAIVLDLQLPDSSGLDTFLRVRNAYPQIPIVIVSHTRNLELAKQMIRLGAEDFINKEFHVNTTVLFHRVVFAIERNTRNRLMLMSTDPPPPFDDEPTTEMPPTVLSDAPPDTLRSGPALDIKE